MKTTQEQRETYRQIVATHAGALTLDESVVLALLDDADEADAMRAVLAEWGSDTGADSDESSRIQAALEALAVKCAGEVGRG